MWIMSGSQTKPTKECGNYRLTNPLPRHFEQIQDLCRRVYPFSKPWNIDQLESHRSYFPDGQLIVIDEDTGRVVGLAFSLIIAWNDYSPQDNWQDFTSGGFFHNHNPKLGKTLYGAEVMVDPEHRGKGIGKMFYAGRQAIVDKYQLKRIRAGARLRGYGKFQGKLTPEEYVRRVVQREIYDPTLSFQLGQNFKVIDVAPNYLFNDPESLGYAAVIEWLNPKTNSEKEYRRQQQKVDLFMSGDKFVPQFLPKELRYLVRKATSALGQAIRDLEGEVFYRKVEAVRELVKGIRNPQKKREVLKVLFDKVERESSSDLMKLAHAFSLQLEVVNVCEAAYRTWRQRQKALPMGIKNHLSLTYVLTAHPTEARSREVLETFSNIQTILQEGIQNKFLFNEAALMTQMRMLWLESLSNKARPSVMDEADYIHSLVLAPEILDFILFEKPGYELKLITWVGGDKDGHPGVVKDVMRECLNRSRKLLIEYASQRMARAISDLEKVADSRRVSKSELDHFRSLYEGLKRLKEISGQDGTKVKTWIIKFKAALKKSGLFVRNHDQVVLLSRLIERFPAFVLPLELREDAGLIREALKDSRAPIRLMLLELSRICGPLEITSYARGLVISHCEKAEDLKNSCELVELTTKGSVLPAIPLFESREALVQSKKLLTEWLKNRRALERIRRFWHGKLEVMFGYSDSAKEMGALPSRLLISRSMHDLDKFLKPLGIQPIFFHGSGGSVARGGGSIKEQISWWSASAVAQPKMTIQGEMIQRLFASKEILNSHCVHFTAEAQRRRVRKVRMEKCAALDRFAKLVSEAYGQWIADSDRLGQMLEASPFKYLDVLRIGSRPVVRPSTTPSVSSLRAIPWVLCWTQTRNLFPAWWGIGSAWKQLSVDEKEKLKELFTKDPFFSSTVKTLAFTLAKVEPDVWELYFDRSNSRGREILISFRDEYERSLKFIHEVSQQNELLWYRPWLGESIRLRSTHIHILNAIQVMAIRRSHESLLRETIVGIACGMLTTG